jgi:hypothetical protein
MTSDMFDRFVPAIGAGAALVLVGAANLLLAGCGVWARGAATAAALGLVGGAVASIGQPGLLASTAQLLALGLAPYLLFSLRPVPARLAATVAALGRARVRAALLTMFGGAALAGSVVLFDRADRTAMEADTFEMELMLGRPRSVLNEEIRVTTDRGTRIVLREPVRGAEQLDRRSAEERMLRGAKIDEDVIRRGPADDRANCHGWTFTGGQFLLTAEDVELILAENGYQQTRDPRPGDLVIYRHAGAISHSAVVRYVTEGQPVLVEGKWGQLGVFLHPPEKCTYGTDYTFYHSGRRGHLLVGLTGPDRSEGQVPQMTAE